MSMRSFLASAGISTPATASADGYLAASDFKLFQNAPENYGGEIFDDFVSAIYSGATSYLFSEVTWGTQLVNTGTITTVGTTMISEFGHPGLLEMSTGAGTNGAVMISNMNNSLSGVKGFIGGTGASGDALQYDCVFKIPVLASADDDYRIKFGFGTNIGTSTEAAGAYFNYTRQSSVLWRFACAQSTTVTNATSGVTVTTGWHHARIMLPANGLTATFYMDDMVTPVGYISTNIPTGQAQRFNAIFALDKLAGNTGTTPVLIGVDYVKTKVTLGVARG